MSTYFTHRRTCSMLFVSLYTLMCIQAKDISVLDYLTEEVFSINETEINKYTSIQSIEYDDFGLTFEYDARYAVFTSYTDRLGEALLPPNTIAHYCDRILAGVNIPAKVPGLKDPDGFKSLRITILEQEYVDLSPYNLPSGQLTFHAPAKSRQSSDIGFVPENLLVQDRLPSVIMVGCTVQQYCADTQTLRAYTHLKVRMDFSKDKISRPDNSSIHNATPNETESDVIYFNLRGNRIRKPQPGECYIERNGTKSKLLIN